MAKIEIPDSMVPEGYEVTGEYRVPLQIGFELWEPHLFSGGVSNCNPFKGNHVILRRKPRLKKIVFTVAGEPRQIQRGEWFISVGGSPLMGDSFTPTSPRTPLTREEVYE